MLHICLLPLQANDAGCVRPRTDWDAGLCIHPQPGSPVGRLYHSWSFRVSKYRALTDASV